MPVCAALNKNEGYIERDTDTERGTYIDTEKERQRQGQTET